MKDQGGGFLDKLKPQRTDYKPLPGFDALVKAFQVTTAGLDENIRHVAEAKPTCFDLTSVANAISHLTELPAPGQIYHCVCKGNYSQFDLVPAFIELGRAKIQELYLVTLAFSSQNVQALAELLDTGRVQRVSVLCSHYFKAQNQEIYDLAAHQLGSRGHRLMALRTHAKIIAAKLVDGRTYTSEGSANLRSCRNLEQFTITADPGVYAFHRGWIEKLLNDYQAAPGGNCPEGKPDARPRENADAAAETGRKLARKGAGKKRAKAKRRSAAAARGPRRRRKAKV